MTIAAASAVALFIIMFLSWFGIGDVPDIEGVDVEGIAEASGVDTTANAWQSFDFIDIVLLVTILVTVGVAAMTASATQVNLPVAGSALVAGLGLLSLVLVAYRIIDPPAEAGREFGVFLGLIATLGIAAGGWMAMQDEGTSFGDQADRLGGGGTGPDAAPPPPPPPPAGGTGAPPGGTGAPPGGTGGPAA